MSLEVGTGKPSEPGVTKATAEPRPSTKDATTNAPKKGPAKKSTTAKRSTSTSKAKTTEKDETAQVENREGQDASLKQLELTGDPALQAPAPNGPVEEGVVQITRRAKDDEDTDPAGNVTETEKLPKPSKTAKNPFEGLDTTKLPLTVEVGQVQISVRLHIGRPIVTMSMVGWIGPEALALPAENARDIAKAVEQLEKLL